TGRACMAVGSFKDSTGKTRPLAESLTNTTWTILNALSPAGATLTQLRGVECTAASACMAVGHSIDGNGAHHFLAEVWNGTSWAIQATPEVAGTMFNELNGISCSAANACTAVGTSAERWNGTSWALQKIATPRPHTGPSDLNGVSCPAKQLCVAVGSY